MKLAKGTEIVCPNCNEIMLIAIDDIFIGTVIGPHHFEQVKFRGEKGSPLFCPDCKTNFFRTSEETGGQLYTTRGWK